MCQGGVLLLALGLLVGPACGEDSAGGGGPDAGGASSGARTGGGEPGGDGDGDGDGDGSTGDGDGDGDGSTGDGDGDSSPEYLGGCPETFPEAGTCDDEGRLCSYGDSPRVDCRDRAICDGGSWSPERGGCAPPASATECPAEAPLTGGDACNPGTECAYPDRGVSCQCLATPGIGAGSMWVCEPPTLQSDACPELAPNAGTGCDTPGSTTCRYGASCQLGRLWISASCGADGIWTWVTAPCQQDDSSAHDGAKD